MLAIKASERRGQREPLHSGAERASTGSNHREQGDVQERHRSKSTLLSYWAFSSPPASRSLQSHDRATARLAAPSTSTALPGMRPAEFRRARSVEPPLPLSAPARLSNVSPEEARTKCGETLCHQDACSRSQRLYGCIGNPTVPSGHEVLESF